MSFSNGALTARRAKSASNVFRCVALALATAACSQLPGSGPSTQAIIDRASSPDTTVNFDYMLIDVTDPIVNALSLRPAESLAKSFGIGSPIQPLVIRVGDVVDITIWEAGPGGPFSGSPAEVQAGSRNAKIPSQEVTRDGMISVPYVGRMRVVGLKPAEVENLIVNGLTGKSVEPQAVVTVTHAGNTVSVSGEGTEGKRLPLTSTGDRILDIIAEAGGLRIPSREAWVRLTRGPRTVSVPYLSILARPSENVYVRPGDDVTIVQKPLTFTVLGATLQNTMVPFMDDVVTLDEAVAKAGGLLDLRADPEGVFLLRFESADLVRQMIGRPNKDFGNLVVPVVYRLNFRDAGSYFLARRFELHDKDILYVSDHPMAEAQKFFNTIYGVIAPPANAAATGYVLAR